MLAYLNWNYLFSVRFFLIDIFDFLKISCCLSHVFVTYVSLAGCLRVCLAACEDIIKMWFAETSPVDWWIGAGHHGNVTLDTLRLNCKTVETYFIQIFYNL